MANSIPDSSPFKKAEEALKRLAQPPSPFRELEEFQKRLKADREANHTPVLPADFLGGLRKMREQFEEKPPKPPKKSRRKRGDTRELLIGLLVEHHKFDGQGCLNTDPIPKAKIDKLGLSPSTVSRFFGDTFGGRRAYRITCLDSQSLAIALAMLRGEIPPKKFLNAPRS